MRTQYPEHMVLYQGATVGKNHGAEPDLGEGLIMYPGSAVIGACKVAPRTVLAQNASLIDTDTPGDCIIFPGGKIKPTKRDYVAEFFRA